MSETRVAPDERGWFGAYGGRFVPETLVPALQELTEAYDKSRADAGFQAELNRLLSTYVGRPTPLTLAARLTRHAGGARIYLKREDLAHGGAHKINNALAQALLARWMGKRRVIAETGAGQHGVATAMAAALFDLECVVYMGSEDIRRQAPNVQRMKLLGADVRSVDSGSRTLKDAINEAIRDWVTNVQDTYYLLGSVVGPHPYPMMVRDFQAVIGHEARQQILAAEGRLPDALVACVGGGSNAMGLFHAFRDDAVRMVGVEAGGLGIESGRHAARFADPARGRVGVLQGAQSLVLQDDDGQILPTHSISAGLDHASVGPEHVYLKELGRAEYTYATDDEALAAFHLLCRLEGIIPALESAHALAGALRLAAELGSGRVIVVNLSGRGDKDLQTVQDADGAQHDRREPGPNDDYVVGSAGVSPASAAPDRPGSVPRGATAGETPVLRRPGGMPGVGADEAGDAAAAARAGKIPALQGGRIASAFQRAKDEGRAALLPYLMLGYPDPETCLAAAQAVLAAGADGLELGIPFSDPLADGKTIQHAGDVALQQGMTVPRALDLIARLRQSNNTAPLFLMSYLNPLLAYGLDRLCRDAAAAGIDGLIVPDLPAEEEDRLGEPAALCGLTIIHLLAPTSSLERIRTVAERSRGMLYLVSLTGVTGARQTLPAQLPDFVRRVRGVTKLPLAVGFGIGTPEQAQDVGRLADGVIVGSALVERLGNGGVARAADLISSLRSALETGRR